MPNGKFLTCHKFSSFVFVKTTEEGKQTKAGEKTSQIYSISIRNGLKFQFSAFEFHCLFFGALFCLTNEFISSQLS